MSGDATGSYAGVADAPAAPELPQPPSSSSAPRCPSPSPPPMDVHNGSLLAIDRYHEYICMPIFPLGGGLEPQHLTCTVFPYTKF